MRKTLLSTLSLVAMLVGGETVKAQGQLFPPMITEIMYNPPEFGTDSLEFIEIYNPNETAPPSMNLSGYYFSAGIEDTIPFGTVIPPLSSIVIASDSVAFENTFGFPCFEWNNGGLSNSGEGIALRNSQGFLVDTVFYDDNSMWPSEADGEGYSLVICNPSPSINNNLPSSWTASENSTGIFIDDSQNPGNPDFEIFADPNQASNCTTVGVGDNEIITTQIFPNPSNGEFRLQMEAVSETTNLRIFNTMGQAVFSEVIAAGTNNIDLTTGLKAGHYILTLEKGQELQRMKLIVQ